MVEEIRHLHVNRPAICQNVALDGQDLLGAETNGQGILLSCAPLVEEVLDGLQNRVRKHLLLLLADASTCDTEVQVRMEHSKLAVSLPVP